MATHSSVLAWRIPGTGEPGGLPSMGSHRVRHDWSDLAAAMRSEWRVVGMRMICAEHCFENFTMHSYATQRKEVPTSRKANRVCVCVCVCVCVYGGGLVAKSCLTLASPWTLAHPGSSVHGISQARILESVVISFSRGSSWLGNQNWTSCIAGRVFTVSATRKAPIITQTY